MQFLYYKSRTTFSKSHPCEGKMLKTLILSGRWELMWLARAMPLGSPIQAFTGISIFNDIIVAKEWTFNVFTTTKIEESAPTLNRRDRIQIQTNRDKWVMSFLLLYQFGYSWPKRLFEGPRNYFHEYHPPYIGQFPILFL